MRVWPTRRQFVLEMAGLDGREATLTRDLPGGWRQRLALGCAILHEPSIVFLDEPTGGVDPLSRRQFWDLIDRMSAAGTTVLVTTHYLDEAEHCHRIAIIQAGKLAALGTATELKHVFSDRRSSRCRRCSRSRPWRRWTACRTSRRPACSGPRSTLSCGPRQEPESSSGARSPPPASKPDPSPASCPRSRTSSSTSSNGQEPPDMRRIVAVATKELRQILRDRRTLGILLLVPAFILLIYGYALNFDIRDVRAGRAGPRSEHRQPRAGLGVRQLGLFRAGRLRGRRCRPRHARRHQPGPRRPGDSGTVRSRRGVRTPTTVQVVIDGDNANTASTVMGYAQVIVAEFSTALVLRAVTPGGPRARS